MDLDGLRKITQEINRSLGENSLSDNFLYQKVFLKLDEHYLTLNDRVLNSMAQCANYSTFEQFIKDQEDNSATIEKASHRLKKYKGALRKESFEEVENQLAKLRSEWS